MITREVDVVVLSSAVAKISALFLLLLALAPAPDGYSVSTNLSAFAETRGDMALWQACDLRPGISVTFTPNPSYGSADKQGIIADRARLTLRVAPSVPAGRYRLVFLSYSYSHGVFGALEIEYLPVLRVLVDRAVRFPRFQDWPGLDANSGHAVIPHSPCSPLPQTSSPS